MRGEGLVGIVRISKGDLGLTLAARPNLQEIAQSAVAALAAEYGLDAAFVDVVFPGENCRRERGRGSVAVQRLDQVQAPDAVHRVRTTVGASLRTTVGRVDPGIGSVTSDFDP